MTRYPVERPLSAALLVGSLVLAASHLASAAPAPPAWCKQLRSTSGNHNPEHFKDFQSADLTVAIKAAVTESCVDTQEDQYAAKIAAARDALAKRLDLKPEDWADIAQWMNDPNPPMSWDLPAVKSLAELSPTQQYIGKEAEYPNARQDGRAPPLTDSVYYMDALGSKLTETGRLSFLTWCVKGTDEPEKNLTKWAICQGDMATFDVKKLSGELHADSKAPGKLRFYMRLQGFQIAPAIEAVNAAKKKLIASDAAYQKYFDAANAAAADWTKGVGTNTKLLDLVEQMDSAAFFHSRSLLEGCEAKTQAALAEAVSTIPAKSFMGMNDNEDNPSLGFAYRAGPLLANTPVVNLAISAYVTCLPDTAIATHFGYFLSQTPGFRGPRTAALGALQILKVQFDDTRKKAPPMLGFSARPWAGYTDLTSSAGAVLKSAKVTGDKLHITNEKTSIVQQDCVKEHFSNRIADISGGVVHYELVCDQTAPVKHDTTYPDFDVDAKYAAVVKAGMRFSKFGTDIFALWPSKNAALPSWVLFGTVK